MFTFEHGGEISHSFDYPEVKKIIESCLSSVYLSCDCCSYDAAELVLSPMKSVVKSRNSLNNNRMVDLFGFPR